MGELSCYQRRRKCAGAAERLNKSHTAHFCIRVKKLEDQLGTKLVEVVGNKTRLTANATFLLRKAGTTMLEIARQLEKQSHLLSRKIRVQSPDLSGSSL